MDENNTDKSKIFASKTVLIAEDEAPLREILVDRLTETGYKVIEAKNGEETLNLSLKHNPDAILLDQMMPILAGTRVLNEISKTKWGSEVFVIMLTSMSEGANGGVEDLASRKANKYMVKSNVSIDDVLKALEDHFTGENN